jgi:hypothetical protein
MEVQRSESRDLVEEARRSIASAEAQWVAFRQTLEKTRRQIAALKVRCAELDRGEKRAEAPAVSSTRRARFPRR